MAETFDIIVIGAGIAGASVAAHLAESRRVAIIEMEERPGFHSTGRSAAAFEPNYGPAPIRALTRAARSFFESPPEGFAAAPLTVPRETLFLVPDGQEAAATRLMTDAQGLEEIPEAEALRRCPRIRPGFAPRALLDAGTADIDVDLLHQGYLRLFRMRGGTLVCDAPTRAIEFTGGRWRVSIRPGIFAAPILVNAAGAWGDAVAGLARVPPLGLQPKRRSIAVIAAPAGEDVMGWPLVGDAGETWYVKPQSGKLLVSPADATPVDAHDAFADDMTLAEGIDRFQQAIDVEVSHVERTWGGLRTFTPDGNPVCGYDPRHDGFFWLVGQGGYGIQSSPALSRLAAALIVGGDVPPDIAREGLRDSEVAPQRFRI